MSALGVALAKAVAALGGPQVTTVLVVTGLVAGAVGGGVIASGPPGARGQTGDQLLIYPCPETGEVLASVPAGQKFLVTGKSEDQAWLRIHYPLPGRTEAWIQTSPVTLKGALADVPVASCVPELAAAIASPFLLPTLAPGQDNSPSPAPTPAATATPNTGPRLAGLTARPGTIAGGPERYCDDTARSVTFSVKVTDADPIGSVALFYREPDTSNFVRKAMARSGGTDTWQVTLATDSDGIAGSGNLRYYVSATDANANPLTTRLPKSGAETISVARCVNTGPELASLKASPGTVYTNLQACPLRAPPATTTISVAASDVDGVDGLTLFYKLPGDNSYRKEAMSKGTPNWTAKVSPIESRPNADGKVSYYVTAKDKLGETSKSNTKTFTVNRCDYEADIELSNPYPTPMCPSRPTYFYGSALDPDGIDGSSAVLVYRFVRTDGTTKTGRKRMTGNWDGRWYYSVDLTPGAGWRLNRDPFTYYIETTDKYGGVSRSIEGKTTVTKC